MKHTRLIAPVITLLISTALSKPVPQSPASTPASPTTFDNVQTSSITPIETQNNISATPDNTTTQPPPKKAPTPTQPLALGNESSQKNGSKCNESKWPDKVHGLVCGECKVLATNMYSKYKTCDGYCNAVGHDCTGAWEETDDTCNIQYTGSCGTSFGVTSDAICECGGDKNGAKKKKVRYGKSPFGGSS